ncbi:MAG: ABC transporter permease [Halobacteriota archaeon]
MGYRARLVDSVNVAIALVVLVPFAWVVYSAFGVESSRVFEILGRSENLEILVNTVVLVVLVTAASVLISVPLAFVTAYGDVPYPRALSVLVALPLVVPSYIGAFGFVVGFGPRGELQSLLGVERLPSIYGLAGSVLVITLYTYPYTFITTRAALRSVDASVVDAARTLDGSRRRLVREVLLPQAKPAVLAGALLVALYALSDFGTPAIMRYDVYTRVIYVEHEAWRRDVASLLSLQLVALAAVVLFVENRVSNVGDIRSKGGGRKPSLRLGRWKLPATLACLAVPVFALAVPVGVLALWLFRGDESYASGGGFTWEYAWNSVYVAGLAAAVAVAVALPVAYGAARRRSMPSVLAERASYVGYALPGVVLGLGLVFFGSGTPLYQTIPLLVFGYTVKFLPEAVGITRSSFLQFDVRLAEAARTLGSRPLRTFYRVVLPSIAPGVLAGAALVFLTTMKELPITLFLRPAGFDTLVTRVWSAYHEGFYGQAALPALVLVAISALSVFVILSRERYDAR